MAEQKFFLTTLPSVPDQTSLPFLPWSLKMQEGVQQPTESEILFEVPFNSFAIGFFICEFQQPWLVNWPNTSPTARFARFRVTTPNPFTTVQLTLQAINSDGTTGVEGYQESGWPSPAFLLDNAGLFLKSYNVTTPRTRKLADRLRLSFFFVRDNSIGSTQVGLTFGKDTFVETPFPLTFPIHRNLAAAAAIAQRIGTPKRVGPEAAGAVVAAQQRRGTKATGVSLRDIVRLNFTSSTWSPPPETFAGYENIDGDVVVTYPSAGHGVDGNVTLGYVGSPALQARDRDNPASPDERYDSMHFVSSAQPRFQIDVPNGTYQVRVVGGDPTFPQMGMIMSVNGVTYWTGANVAAGEFKDVTREHVVTGGKIEIIYGGGIGGVENSFLNWCLVQRRGVGPPGAKGVVVSGRRGGVS